MTQTHQKNLSEIAKSDNENHENEGEGSFSPGSALDLAIDFWRRVLEDPNASDTAKANAASGLARAGKDELGGHGGAIHQMSRAELQTEIARVRKLI